MTIIKEAINKPQRLFLRRILFQVHLWTGIGLGLYMLVISISGACIVFQDEIENAVHSNLTHASDAAGRQADLATVVRHAQSSYPGYKLRSLSMPSEKVQTFSLELRKDKSRLMAYAHPATARILGHWHRDGSVLNFLNDLHHNLLSGKIGRIVNGFGGLFLCLLCVTGIVIWWPGIKNWKRSLTVDRRRKWKRVNWDLHSAAGFWSLVFISMWALTGAYFAWPNQFRSTINYFSPVSSRNEPESNIAKKNINAAPPLSDLVYRAQQLSPRGRLSRISFPDKDSGPIRIIFALANISDTRYSDNLYFDQYTGQFLTNYRRSPDKTFGDAIVYWISPLHFGTFGGSWIKVLWVLLGLTPALLVVTGSLMWWNRVMSKKLARLRASQPNRKKHLDLSVNMP